LLVLVLPLPLPPGGATIGPTECAEDTDTELGRGDRWGMGRGALGIRIRTPIRCSLSV